MSFDPQIAKLTVDLCRIAYRTEDAVHSALSDLGMADIAFYSGFSTQAFTASVGETSYLAFRGSEAVADWLANAKFLPSDREGGVRIHSGFLVALDEVWDDIVAHLAGAPKLVVTGHSLGAALAIIAAWRLAQAGIPIEAVYSFGQPRTGHRDFRTSYDALLGEVTFRVINHVDLVTRVALLIQGYRHVGRRMYFDHEAKFHHDAGAWQITKDDVRYRLKHFGRIDSIGIAPHLIGSYRTVVDRL